MNKMRISLLALVLTLLHTQAFSQWYFTANITHDQEPGAPGMTPPTTSTGDPRPLSFGTATFVLNPSMTQLTMFATIFNIDVTGMQTTDTNDNLAAAHIHAAAPPGTNAGVRWGFFGTPFNNNMPNDGSLIPFATGVGGDFFGVWDLPEGQATTLTAQIPNLFANLAYINFHTVQFGGGEIRGQIILVPEGGATALMLGMALGGIMFARRYQKRPAVA